MGNSEIPVIDKRAALEMEKEEGIMAKIRDLRKENGRKRGNQRGNPKRKKRRICDDEDVPTELLSCPNNTVLEWATLSECMNLPFLGVSFAIAIFIRGNMYWLQI